MFHLFQKRPAPDAPPAGGKQPVFPFDLSGYTCFTLANCPAERCIQLVEEYEGLCAVTNPRKFQFFFAVLPEDPQWTVIRWSQPGRFYDLMNLTMWSMGYTGCPGAETPLFIALPPEDRRTQGPVLARPDYDNPFMEMMLGFWQGWSFDYTMPGESLRWIGKDVFPPEYFFHGRGNSSTGFQLEWLEHLERIPAWVERTIALEG